MLTIENVLAEFDVWLEGQPDSPAKNWVQENMPGPSHAIRAGIRFRVALAA